MELPWEGGRAFMVQANVGDKDEVQAMVDRVVDEYGPIDILVNNAGVLPPDHDLRSVAERARTLWRVMTRHRRLVGGAIVNIEEG